MYEINLMIAIFIIYLKCAFLKKKKCFENTPIASLLIDTSDDSGGFYYYYLI